MTYSAKKEMTIMLILSNFNKYVQMYDANRGSASQSELFFDMSAGARRSALKSSCANETQQSTKTNKHNAATAIKKRRITGEELKIRSRS